MADAVGFEPTLPFDKTVFKTVGLQPLTHASTRNISSIEPTILYIYQKVNYCFGPKHILITTLVSVFVGDDPACHIQDGVITAVPLIGEDL
jgi:hypothetical protein